MKIAIMQPYFLPYIGYFQLMNSVDKFVIYDNIEYTKKGWINRNRILVNGKDDYITLPLKKDSDFLNVCDRFLADSWGDDRRKMLNRIIESYRKAPFFNETMPVIQEILNSGETNLFSFVYNSIIKIKQYLDIPAEILISSEIEVDHGLKSSEKVISICKMLQAEVYINSIGGIELYDRKIFLDNGLTIKFMKSNPILYKQFNPEFVPWLSVLDVLMFNSVSEIKRYLTDFQLL